ncbi:MAG: FecR domain-containing protein [Patescibacteria group bacterium]|nr:FecR domain-containing protein [Patescibacteria group bacterium]
MQTATGSRVSILFSDKSLVRLDENTLLEIQELSLTPESRKTQLFLYYGRSWSRILQPFSHEESFYRVDTDDTVSRALGTVFSVAYNKDTKESFLEVLESEVKFELKNPNDLSSNREVRKIDSIIVSEGYSSSIDHDEITEYEEKRKNLESHKDNMNDGMWNSWNMLEDKTFLENEKEALEASLKEYQKQTVSQQIINTFTGDESITENKTLYLHIQDQIRKLPLEEERKLWMKKSNAESIKDLVDQDNKDQQDSSDNTESDISDTLDSSTNATSSSNSFIQKTPLSLEYYTIDPGESLSSIGIYYDIDWEELAEINNISDPYPVFVGQKLKLTSEMQDKIQAKDAAVAAKKKAQESWSKNNTTDDQ